MPRPTPRPLREALQVDLGGAVQAHFVREASGETARVVRGAIRVSEPRGERFVEPTPRDAARGARRCRRAASPPASR